MTEQIFAFLTASILLTVSPGPDILFVLVQSISNGKNAGIYTTLGLISGILIHTTLVAFGISVLINQSETIFLIIKIFGALYLFSLAYKVFKGPSEIAILAGDTKRKQAFALFKKGFIMNVLNPKVTIFFLAFFPAFLWEPKSNTILQFYILGGLFMLQAFLIFSTVALLAGKISLFLQKNPSAGIFLKWVQIIVFVGIGVFILV